MWRIRIWVEPIPKKVFQFTNIANQPVVQRSLKGQLAFRTMFNSQPTVPTYRFPSLRDGEMSQKSVSCWVRERCHMTWASPNHASKMIRRYMSIFMHMQFQVSLSINCVLLFVSWMDVIMLTVVLDHQVGPITKQVALPFQGDFDGEKLVLAAW